MREPIVVPYAAPKKWIEIRVEESHSHPEMRGMMK
jgi:hypothetical protein